MLRRSLVLVVLFSLLSCQEKESLSDLHSFLSQDDRFSSFYQNLTDEQKELLQSDARFTVFAYTNEHTPGYNGDLSENIIIGKFPINPSVVNNSLPTLQDPITITYENDCYLFKNNKIISSNIRASNGYLNLIEADLNRSSNIPAEYKIDYDDAKNSLEDNFLHVMGLIGFSIQVNGIYTDELKTTSSSWEDYDHHEISPSNRFLLASFNESLIAITRANQLIYYINEGSVMSQEDNNQFLAEIMVLKAMNYFYQLQLWGASPLYESPHPKDSDIRRSPENEVIAYIINLLENALPKYSNPNGVVIAKDIGEIFLAKSYMLKEEWQKSLDILQKLNQNYDLLSSYAMVFEKTNAEVIQFYDYDSYHSEIIPIFPEMVTDEDLVQSYALSDSRYDISVDSSTFGIKKYNLSNFLIPICRKADILLLLAEINIYQENIISARKYLNEVRNRAGLGLSSSDNPTELLELVKGERRKELAFEGHRFFDLKRWGDFVQVMGKKEDNIEPYKALLPIPKMAFSFYENYYQNPGY